MEILLGTNNENKLRQFRRMFSKFFPEVRLFSLLEKGIEDDIEEDGETLLENASKKARFFGEKSKMLTLSDDTGLFVDALNGDPGMHAKRWHKGTEKDRNLKLIERLKDVPENERTCHYLGVLAVYNPKNGKIWVYEGKTEGWISDQFRGESGFGYDAIFKTKKYPGCHYAELDHAKKDWISHRGRGIRKLAKEIENIL
ncbi:MAG TPA: non-canonical purine NTP pyrophosphatase [Candidatus Moranbacteria bacterium]|nr:non-canonical purine NTP pyrophosphatase [Candidatus Moranbacteria bacterium]